MKPDRLTVGRFGIVMATAMAIALTAACSPAFNWREVRSENHDYLVLLPAKPAKLTRKIRLDQIEVSMTMQGARVDDASFTVAVAELPQSTDEARRQASAAMQAGMLRNIGASTHEQKEHAVAIVDAAGQAGGRVPASLVEAAGVANGRPVRMSAGFTALGARAYQWVAIMPETAGADEHRKTFIESFKIIQTGPSR